MPAGISLVLNGNNAGKLMSYHPLFQTLWLSWLSGSKATFHHPYADSLTADEPSSLGIVYDGLLFLITFIQG